MTIDADVSEVNTLLFGDESGRTGSHQAVIFRKNGAARRSHPDGRRGFGYAVLCGGRRGQNLQNFRPGERSDSQYRPPRGSAQRHPYFRRRYESGQCPGAGPGHTFSIKKDQLQSILRQYPNVALNTNKVLAQRMRLLVTLVEDLSFRHVLGRVTKILLTHAGDGAGNTDHLTQQEMAAMAGTAREVVARSLKSLEEQGLIRLERHRIVITDKKALEDIVEDSG